MEANRTWHWPVSPQNNVTVTSDKPLSAADIDRLIQWLELVKLAWYPDSKPFDFPATLEGYQRIYKRADTD